MMTRTVIALFVLVLADGTVLYAQPVDRSVHWGIIASATPHWTAASPVKKYVGADQYDISGAEIAVGFVRGRSTSGDWGVSVVRKTVADGATSRFATLRLCIDQHCAERSTSFVASGISMLGVEGHRFFNLATIRRRVQIGLNVAAGVTSLRGRAQKIERSLAFVTDAGTGNQHLAQVTQASEVDPGQIFSGGNQVRLVPLAKAEIGLGIALTPALKMRISSGADFPGYHIASVNMIYLLGRRRSIFGD